MGGIHLAVEVAARDVAQLIRMHKVLPQVQAEVNQRLQQLVRTSMAQLELKEIATSLPASEVAEQIMASIVDRVVNTEVPRIQVSEAERRTADLHHLLQQERETSAERLCDLEELTVRLKQHEEAKSYMMQTFFHEVAALRKHNAELTQQLQSITNGKEQDGARVSTLVTVKSSLSSGSTLSHKHPLTSQSQPHQPNLGSPRTHENARGHHSATMPPSDGLSFVGVVVPDVAIVEESNTGAVDEGEGSMRSGIVSDSPKSPAGYNSTTEVDALFDYERYVAITNAAIISWPQRYAALEKKMADTISAMQVSASSAALQHQRQLLKVQNQLHAKELQVAHMSKFVQNFRPIIIGCVRELKDTLLVEQAALRKEVTVLQKGLADWCDKLSERVRAIEQRFSLFTLFVQYCNARLQQKLRRVVEGGRVRANQGKPLWQFFLLSGNTDAFAEAKMFWQEQSGTQDLLEAYKGMLLLVEAISENRFGPPSDEDAESRPNEILLAAQQPVTTTTKSAPNTGRATNTAAKNSSDKKTTQLNNKKNPTPQPAPPTSPRKVVEGAVKKGTSSKGSEAAAEKAPSVSTPDDSAKKGKRIKRTSPLTTSPETIPVPEVLPTSPVVLPSVAPTATSTNESSRSPSKHPTSPQDPPPLPLFLSTSPSPDLPRATSELNIPPPLNHVSQRPMPAPQPSSRTGSVSGRAQSITGATTGQIPQPPTLNIGGNSAVVSGFKKADDFVRGLIKRIVDAKLRRVMCKIRKRTFLNRLPAAIRNIVSHVTQMEEDLKNAEAAVERYEKRRNNSETRKKELMQSSLNGGALFSTVFSQAHASRSSRMSIQLAASLLQPANNASGSFANAGSPAAGGEGLALLTGINTDATLSRQSSTLIARSPRARTGSHSLTEVPRTIGNSGSCDAPLLEVDADYANVEATATEIGRSRTGSLASLAQPSSSSGVDFATPAPKRRLTTIQEPVEVHPMQKEDPPPLLLMSSPTPAFSLAALSALPPPVVPSFVPQEVDTDDYCATALRIQSLCPAPDGSLAYVTVRTPSAASRTSLRYLGTPSSSQRAPSVANSTDTATYHIPSLPAATSGRISAKSRAVYKHEIELRSGSRCAVAASLPSPATPPTPEFPQLSRMSCVTPVFPGVVSAARTTTTPSGFRRAPRGSEHQSTSNGGH